MLIQVHLRMIEAFCLLPFVIFDNAQSISFGKLASMQ